MRPARHGGSAEGITVFSDAPPLTRDIAALSDQTSLRLFTLSTFPLTTLSHDTHDIEPLGAKGWEVSSDKRKFTFHLRDNIYWDDGTPITGEDYARGIHTIISYPRKRFRHLFVDVRGFASVSAEQGLTGLSWTDDTVTFALRNANALFPMLLSFIGASPRHATLPHMQAGAYDIIDWCSERISLAPRRKPNLITSEAHCEGSPVDFDLCTREDDPFAFERFGAGHVHRTCDTHFPYGEAEGRRQSDAFRFTQTRIKVLLADNGCQLPLSPDARLAILHGVNRAQLRDELHHVPSIITGLGSPFPDDAADPLCDPAPYRLRRNTPLIVAYEDFYPNRLILDAIRIQLAAVGIDMTPVATGYGHRRGDCHLRLELVANPFPDPLPLYRNEASKLKLHEDAETAHKYLHLLTRYQVSDRGERMRLGKQMDDMLLAKGQLVPLIELPGMELRHPGLKDCHFRPGVLWRWDDGVPANHTATH